MTEEAFSKRDMLLRIVGEVNLFEPNKVLPVSQKRLYSRKGIKVRGVALAKRVSVNVGGTPRVMP